MPLLNSPEYIRLARKMMNDPKVSNMLNQLPIKNIPGMGNFANDLKDLFDEDNSEELNDLKKSLKNINFNLNEEDKKDENHNEFKDN